MIRTRFATVEWTPDGAVSRFQDGSRWGALPHDTPSYYAIAARLGYEADTLTYCRHHEVAHHVVAEEFGKPSRVIWALAHGWEPCRHAAACEEGLALALQRYVMTNEHPMVDRIDWQALRERMRGLLAEIEQ